MHLCQITRPGRKYVASISPLYFSLLDNTRYFSLVLYPRFKNLLVKHVDALKTCVTRSIFTHELPNTTYTLNVVL